MSTRSINPKQGRGGSYHAARARYDKAIAEVERKGDAIRGFCHSEAVTFVERFPELILVRDNVFSLTTIKQYIGGIDQITNEDIDVENGHWWCETPDGQIVDPTRAQVGDWQAMHYAAFDESKPHKLPTGKCYNCGYLCYGRSDGVCSDDCGNAYAAYLNNEVRQHRF